MKCSDILGIAVLVASISFPLSAQSGTATQYFCNVDSSTGFKFVGGKWSSQNFYAEDKYLLKEIIAEYAGPYYAVGDKIWELTQLGGSEPIAVCSDWKLDSDENRQRGELIKCDSFLYKAKFDKKNLRFLFSYFTGYTDGIDNNQADTPVISIGKCSPL